MGTASQLAAVLTPLEPRHCELDLAQLSFMDSTGLALLLTHHRHAQAAGGSLRIVHPSPAVTRVLELTGTRAILLADPGPPHP
ncbi:anti-sigma B factor antagonist [Streptomyces sp. V4I8]